MVSDKTQGANSTRLSKLHLILEPQVELAYRDSERRKIVNAQIVNIRIVTSHQRVPLQLPRLRQTIHAIAEEIHVEMGKLDSQVPCSVSGFLVALVSF